MRQISYWGEARARVTGRGLVKIDGGALRLPASDVADFLACGHLTRLDLLHARGQLHPPREFGTGFEDLVRRGEAHGKAVLDRFRADGWRVAEIGEAPEAEAMRATLEAIRSGAGVVYQGVFAADQAADGSVLFGRPDFLVWAGLLGTPDGEPRPGEAHYEVVDAKLARSAKARSGADRVLFAPAGGRAGHPAAVDAPAHSRADRLARATVGQMEAALGLLSMLNPEAFEIAFTAVPLATHDGDDEPIPVCRQCGGLAASSPTAACAGSISAATAPPPAPSTSTSPATSRR